MRDLSATVIGEIQRPHQVAPYLELWNITIARDESATTRLAIADVTESTTFDGVTYYPWKALRSDLSQDSEGGLPRLSLTLANTTRELANLLEKGQGMRGMPATMSLVHYAHLTTTDRVLQMDWVIAGASISDEVIVLDMQVGNWFEKQVPPMRFARDRCIWRFKSDECGYQSSGFTSCGKTWSDCVARGNDEVSEGYPRQHPLQIGAFPGLHRGARR